MTTLEQHRDRFVEVLKCKEPIRTKRLTNLMNDMEICYGIPMLYSATFESNYPGVMQLYRYVNKARDMEGVK